MRHNLPATPAFTDLRPDDPIQQVVLRVIVALPAWEMHVVGTASLIAGSLAITAKHVLDYIIEKFGSKRDESGPIVVDYNIRLLQVKPGEDIGYRYWDVMNAWTCPNTDIAILQVVLNEYGGPEPDGRPEPSPRVRLFPPPSGEKVIACGFRESRIEVTEDEAGVHHVVLNDKITNAIGEVGEIFPVRRDSSMLNFPCFEVFAKFAHQMSGGIVIDQNGALCGLICSGLDEGTADVTPLSYAVTLWPMLLTIIGANRRGNFPRDVEYPMIDLALDGIISTVGLELLDRRLFPGTRLP